MKCPVCYTTIPLGESRCPNCGMIIKKEPSTHNEQETSHKPYTKATNDTLIKISNSFDKKFRAISFTIPLVSFFILGICIMGLVKDDDSISTSRYSEQTYIEYCDDRAEDLKQMGWNIDDSHVAYYSSQSTCKISIDASKDNIHYAIDYVLYQSDINSLALEISGSYEGNESNSYLYLDEKTLNPLCSYLQFDNVYSLFKDTHNNLIFNQDNPNEKFYSGYHDNYEIYINESYQKNNNTTLFSYSVAK